MSGLLERAHGSHLVGGAPTNASTPTVAISLDAANRSTSIGEASAPGPSYVDKSKVEAAFRSKPQPGKKRADLTEGERQELAKARNREHARQARSVTRNLDTPGWVLKGF